MSAHLLPLSDARRVPRALHPGAWWIWAGCLSVIVARTTNPLLLVLVLAVVGLVVARRRTDAPWARAFRYYLLLGAVVIVLRVVLRIVFGSGALPGDHVLLTLPQLPTPHWYAGITIGGPVTVEATLAAAVDGLRLATLLCCVGAANALANPRRALRLLPGALYELGVAVVVAVTVAPQLVESVQRVGRARRLRGGRTRGIRGLRALVVPVLEDAFDRSLHLAAAMDSRGYGRTGSDSRGSRRLTGGLLVTGLLGLVVGVAALLDATAPRLVGPPALVAGAALCCTGLALGGRRVHRSSYRPDPWTWPEWTVTAAGVAGVALVAVAAGTAGLNPPTSPLAFPPLPVLPAVAVLLGALAAVAAPPPEHPLGREPAAAVPLPAGVSPERREPVLS